jgi:hypothetical protein
MDNTTNKPSPDGDDNRGLPEAPAEALDMPKCCTLCKSPNAPIEGLFIPPEGFSQRIGAPADKTRLLTYALCEPCYQLPGKADLVEAEILKLMAVQ